MCMCVRVCACVCARMYWVGGFGMDLRCPTETSLHFDVEDQPL